MNILSAISIIACMLYLFIGMYTYLIEKKSSINRLFLAFCISMAIWSFSYAFVYVTTEQQYIWMKLSAVGWCSFASFILHLVLLFTGNRFIVRKRNKFLLYVPSVVFFYISVFLFWKNTVPSKFIQNFFYIGDFLYNFIFLAASIILIAIWGTKSRIARVKKQARIIVISSTVPFLFNLFTQDVLPVFGIDNFPNMGHLYSLVMIFGIYYTMIKYRLFEITPRILVEGLLQEMVDMVILVSPEGRILKINDSAEKLLGYRLEQIFQQPLEKIIDEPQVRDVLLANKKERIHRFPEINCRRKDGDIIQVKMTCSLIIDPNIEDVLGMLMVGQDILVIKMLEKKIEEHKRAEEKIRYLAYHDSLTGLPNRKYFYEKLNETLDNSRLSGEMFAVFFLDVDKLKAVNDKFGHMTGDLLICEVGRRAYNCVGKNDLVARISGDEFNFIIFDIHSVEEAQIRAMDIICYINRPFMTGNHELMISTSIGISVFPQDGDDADMLVKRADNMMYKSKKEKSPC